MKQFTELLEAYNEKKLKAIGEILDEASSLDRHIETAYNWHGGGGSPLYQFASTGGKVHSDEHRNNLKNEIQKNIAWVNTEGKKYPKEYSGEDKKLGALLKHVNSAPVHVKEEASEEEFNKEVDTAKKQSQGKIRKKVAAAAVQSVEIQKEEAMTDYDAVKHIAGTNSHGGGKMAETQGTRTMISAMKNHLGKHYVSLDDSKRFKNREQVLKKISKVTK